jgi:D-aspartate ligase
MISRSVLLASGSSSGTVAAVRNLGANGIDVGVISSHVLSAAAWSHWASGFYSAPAEKTGHRFINRLLEIGKRKPGQILLPTSDETAWLYTINADLLKQQFCLYQPPIATIHNILDKKLFQAAASKAGLAVLPSWYPSGIQEVKALAPRLPYPILIKPRTQVYRLWTDKGAVVSSPEDLIHQYQQLVAREQTRASDNDPLLADAHTPMLQQFVAVGREGVLSVSGFIDRTGNHFVTRHSTKILQRSQPVGVGVCFESPPSVAMLSDVVHRLCRDLGYFGIFEVEFLRFNGSWAAIDFNPRLFHQLGMDIRRGMPLPLLACLDAAGEMQALRIAVARAQKAEEDRKIVFCDRFLLEAILLARSLTGQISRKDRLNWQRWRKRNAAFAVDAAVDGTDPMPGAIHALCEFFLGLRVLTRVIRSKARINGCKWSQH